MAALAQRRRAAARRRALGAAAGVLAAAALATPLLLLTGSAAAPSLADALTPAHKAAVAHVAEPVDGRPTLPHLTGAGLAFPYWGDRFGWTATGLRRDRLSGRTLTTVLYRRGQLWLAYTIVSGAPLRPPASAHVEVRNGTRLTTFSLARPKRRHLAAPRPHLRALRLERRPATSSSRWAHGGRTAQSRSEDR